MPKATLQDMLDKRNNAATNMRNIIDLAKREDRDLTDSEISQCDTFEKEMDDWDTKYKKGLKDHEREEKLSSFESQLNNPASQRKSRPSNPSSQEEERITVWNPLKDYDASYKYSKYNERRLNNSHQRASAEYSKAYRKYLLTGDESSLQSFGQSVYMPRHDVSQQQSDDDVRGGYTVPSETFAEGFIKEVDDQTWIWKNSRLIIVRQSQSLGIRKMTAKMSSWGKGSELSDAFDNEDDSIRWGNKTLSPQYFTGAAKVSRDLIRVSTLDIEQILYSEFARDLGYVVEQEDIAGNGVGGPLGVLVNSPDGISSARDTTSSSSSSFTAENLYDMKYALKVQYRNRARWMFHRNNIKTLAKMRDNIGGAGTGQFLWQPALRAGEPDTLLGLPLDENEFFPTATGTGVYFGILAVWEYYVHAIGLDMEILRLVETGAKKNQIEYVARVKLDGLPVLEEAFQRIKYGS